MSAWQYQLLRTPPPQQFENSLRKKYFYIPSLHRANGQSSFSYQVSMLRPCQRGKSMPRQDRRLPLTNMSGCKSAFGCRLERRRLLDDPSCLIRLTPPPAPSQDLTETLTPPPLRGEVRARSVHGLSHAGVRVLAAWPAPWPWGMNVHLCISVSVFVYACVCICNCRRACMTVSSFSFFVSWQCVMLSGTLVRHGQWCFQIIGILQDTCATVSADPLWHKSTHILCRKACLCVSACSWMELNPISPFALSTKLFLSISPRFLRREKTWCKQTFTEIQP